jgi:hypothetical protein
MSDERKEHFGIIGVGAAACAACCAGPILAFLGGLSFAGLASTLLIGTLGLAVFVASGTGYLLVRRRRQTPCATPSTEAVSVAAPTRKPPT